MSKWTKSGRKYYLKHKLEARQKSYRWRKNNPEKFRLNCQKSALKRKFGSMFPGIVEWFDKQKLIQNNLCLVCGHPETKVNKGATQPCELSVDHNHTTNTIRGLICHKCNAVLGFVNDDANLLLKLVEYINQHG